MANHKYPLVADALLDYYKSSNFSADYKRTMDLYFPHIKKVLGDIRTNKLTDLDTRTLRDYIKSLGLAESTREMVRALWRTFTRWLRKELILDKDIMPCWNLEHKEKKRQKRNLTPAEIQKLHDTAIEMGFPEYARYIIFAVSSGRRLAECLRLKHKDIIRNDEGVFLDIQRQKNKKKEILPLSPNAIKAIGTGNPDDFVFNLVDHNRDFSSQRCAVHHQITEIGQKAGIPANPHLFRAVFASTLLSQKINPATVAYLGSWKSIPVMLKAYAQPNSTHEIQAIYQQRDSMVGSKQPPTEA